MAEDTGQDTSPAGGDGEAAVLAPLEPGTEVCVWNHFLDHWTGGFAVAFVDGDGYRLARLSDGLVFDDVFPFGAVMPERRRRQLSGFVGTDADRRREQTTDELRDRDGRREPFLR
jgi:hypothetical protein